MFGRHEGADYEMTLLVEVHNVFVNENWTEVDGDGSEKFRKEFPIRRRNRFVKFMESNGRRQSSLQLTRFWKTAVCMKYSN